MRYSANFQILFIVLIGLSCLNFAAADATTIMSFGYKNCTIDTLGSTCLASNTCFYFQMKYYPINQTTNALKSWNYSYCGYTAWTNYNYTINGSYYTCEKDYYGNICGQKCCFSAGIYGYVAGMCTLSILCDGFDITEIAYNTEPKKLKGALSYLKGESASIQGSGYVAGVAVLTVLLAGAIVAIVILAILLYKSKQASNINNPPRGEPIEPNSMIKV